MPTAPLLLSTSTSISTAAALSGARGSNHRCTLPLHSSRLPWLCAHFLAASLSPPASVPHNCKGLYSEGPTDRSTPLTPRDSGCSDVETLVHTRGSICLPLKHADRSKLISTEEKHHTVSLPLNIFRLILRLMSAEKSYTSSKRLCSCFVMINILLLA